MSWLYDLYQTYNNCAEKIGQSKEGGRPLLPLFHTTIQAHIEVTIDEGGHFRNAAVIDKNDAETILPCTEKSSSRTSGPVPHGLCDKLQYVARDYDKFGSKDSQFSQYMKQLDLWNSSQDAHIMAVVVYKYLSENDLMQDLIDYGVITLDEDGKVLQTYTGDKDLKPPLMKVVSNQTDSVVRWIVQNDGPSQKTWLDGSLRESWINYQLPQQSELSLCYISGKEAAIAENHPKYIRTSGDGAKLISSNDTANYTYRGRFINAGEACQISAEVSQKAHNSLKWLISKQGRRFGEKVVLAWAVQGEDVPDITQDTDSMIEAEEDWAEELQEIDEYAGADTEYEFAQSFNKLIAGYSAELTEQSNIVLLILDSANPGRLSVVFYRRLQGSEFLERVKNWHETCYWRHEYKSSKKEKKVFYGAPAPKDIVMAMHGARCDDKLAASIVERIIPCIIDGRKLPDDIFSTIMQRAKKREALEDWEFKKMLTIACALYNKQHESEGYTVALQRDRTSRDYLYGRLLAVAQCIEKWALNESGEKRLTNAERMMQRFADRPYSAYRTIELALVPYKQRLGARAKKYYQETEEIMSLFDPGDFTDDRQLKGEFLLGYYCQLNEFKNKKDDDTDEEE